MELRCDNKKHGEIVEGILEIKCSSRFCGAGPGVVIIHRWDVLNGLTRLADRKFADPVVTKKRRQTQ